MRCLAGLNAMVVAVFVASDTWAASAVFESTKYEATSRMREFGVPGNALIHDFLVTTNADILSIGNVQVSGVDLWNPDPPLGFGDNFPNCDFIFCSPAWDADSFITSPGFTSRLGPPLPGNGTSSYGDLTNDGPQNNFLFARITTLNGTRGRFEGRATLAGTAGPESFPFSFPIGVPEPTTLTLVGFGVFGVFGLGVREG